MKKKNQILSTLTPYSGFYFICFSATRISKTELKVFFVQKIQPLKTTYGFTNFFFNILKYIFLELFFFVV